MRAAGHKTWSPREAANLGQVACFAILVPSLVSQPPRGRAALRVRRTSGLGGPVGHVRAPAAGGRWEPSEFLRTPFRVLFGGSQRASSA